MTTTILVPPDVAALEPLEVDSSASTVTTSLRGAATQVSDAVSSAEEKGLPPSWSGDSAKSAGSAMTEFARRADAAVAALEVAARACDVYVEQMAGLRLEHTRLSGERITHNRDVATLLADINSATEEQVPALQARATRLQEAYTRLEDDIADMWRRVGEAEDRLISAFASADSPGEGRSLADATDRPDTDVLRRELSDLGGDSDAVYAWWNSLTPAQREALLISDPDLVGNTNGIPIDDRDEANRASLDRDLDRLGAIPKEDRTAEQEAWLLRAREAEKALQIPGAQYDPMTGLPVDVNLVMYAPTAFGGDGAVGVAFGNPDTADNTAVVVPGIMNDGSNIAGNSEDAFRLFNQANGNGESTATIAWMGYDSPSFNPTNAWSWPGNIGDIGSVVSEGKAEAGGAALADFVDGLRSTDQGDRSHLSVIGHSYGSTTASHAAHDHGLDADSLTLIGSPGAGGDDVNHVRDLGMGEGKVYVGSAENDFVTWLGRDGELGMGRDPSQVDFGAKVFEVDDGEEFTIPTFGTGVDNHTSYFDANSSSLDNLTSIVRGDEPDLVEGRTTPANDRAVDFVEDEARRTVIEPTQRWIDDRVSDAQDLAEDVKDWHDERVEDMSRWADERWEDFSSLWR